MELDKRKMQEIRRFCRQKLLEYSLVDSLVGTQIFTVLDNECEVIYYPLDDKEVWGFLEVVSDKLFVCINTSLTYDRQTIAAAHALYHVCFDKRSEVMLGKNMICELDSTNLEEMAANRFVEEFLISEENLLTQMDVYHMDRYSLEIRDIVRLAAYFIVPFHTMVYRLNTLGLLKSHAYEWLIRTSERQIEIWRMRLALPLLKREDLIGLGSLVDNAIMLYEKKLITFERLEYLLEFAELNPADVDISDKDVSFQDIHELFTLMEDRHEI